MATLSMRRSVEFSQRFCLLVLWAFCFPAVGQVVVGTGPVGAPSQLDTNPQSKQKPHTVRGQIVNSITGEPIYRALVEIGALFATLTDHEGRFELEDVTTPDTYLSARKPGYKPDAQSSPSSMDANQSEENKSVTLKLVPESILSGTLTGPEGEPLEDVQIRLKTLNNFDGAPHWTQRMQTMTNSLGQYRFTDLEAGNYAIETALHVEGLQDEQSTFAHMAVRYPAAGSPVQAMKLATGEHKEASLTAPIEKLYPVTGTVEGYGGEHGGLSLTVEFAGGEDLSPPLRFDAGAGDFRMLLPGGTFHIKATVYLPSGSKRGQLELTVPGVPVSGVTVKLEPSAAIPVEIDAQTINQPEKGSVAVPPTVNLNLVTVDPLSSPETLNARLLDHANPASNGTGPQVFESVPSGRYRLQAYLGSPWYVSSANCGGIDLMHEEIVIGGSAAGCSIRLLLRNDSGSLHVSILRPATAQGAKPATVYLIPVDDQIKSMQLLSGQGREANMDGVAPGRYLVLALVRASDWAYRDPEVLKRYAAVGREITVVPNSNAEVEVNLVDGEP